MRRRRQDIDGRELLGISSSFFSCCVGWGWLGWGVEYKGGDECFYIGIDTLPAFAKVLGGISERKKEGRESSVQRSKTTFNTSCYLLDDCLSRHLYHRAVSSIYLLEVDPYPVLS